MEKRIIAIDFNIYELSLCFEDKEYYYCWLYEKIKLPRHCYDDKRLKIVAVEILKMNRQQKRLSIWKFYAYKTDVISFADVLVQRLNPKSKFSRHYRNNERREANRIKREAIPIEHQLQLMPVCRAMANRALDELDEANEKAL